MKPLVRSFAQRQALEDALVAELRSLLTQPPGQTAAQHRAIMLSGGSTPIPAYRSLAAERLPRPAGLYILFSDDRYVPSTSDASNYHQSLPLLESLHLEDEQVLRVRTELPLSAAVDRYAQDLADLAERQIPIVLALVGLGADGHTCSLFSAADLERANDRDAIAVARPDGRDAVSVTPRVLERAQRVVFVVSGADKQSAVRALVQQERSQTAARAVAGCHHVELWADRDALGLVTISG